MPARKRIEPHATTIVVVVVVMAVEVVISVVVISVVVIVDGRGVCLRMFGVMWWAPLTI